jgi:hypothetical protein
MSQFTGTVISVAVNVQVKGQSKSYPGYELVYRTEDGKVQTLAKHMNSLKFSPSVAATLNDLQPGDTFVCVQQKNDAGFLDVVSLTKGSEAPALQPAATTNSAATTVSPTNRGKVTGSTYETPEERQIRRAADAVRQKLIIRQSSIDQARQLLSKNVEGVVKLDQVFEVAAKIEEWVMRDVETIPH